MKWEVKKLGEVCDFYNGKAHEKSIDENGKYKVVNSKFVSSNGISAKRTDKAQFPLFTGDIVMVMSDVPNGKTLAKCFLIDQDDTYSLNQRVCAIRTNNFDKKFLYYQLNRNQYFLKFNNGENQTNLRKGDILDCPLLIPPIEEQKRIVKILDKSLSDLDQAKANTEQNLKNAKELFESYLQGVFENKGDDWEEKTILELCDYKSQIVGGPFGSNLKVSDYKESGIPILRLQNIGKGYFIDKDIKYVSKEKAEELAYHSFKSGDIVLAKLGIPIGKTCIVPNDFEYGIVVADVVRIRPNGESINYNFLCYFLNSDNAVNQLSIGIKGATRPRVNIAEVRNLKLNVPPLETQKQIVQKLDALQAETKKLEAIYQKKIEDLEELKKSVLQKALALV